MARYARTQTIEEPIGRDGRFSLRVTAADVRLRGVDAEVAVVRATFEIPAPSDSDADAVFEEVRLVATAAPGQLSVEEPRSTHDLRGLIARLLSGKGEIEYSVEVDVPRAAAVHVETVSGELTAQGLQGEQRYQTVSGDAFLADAGGAVRINSVSGDVVVRATRPLSARVESVSGDLSLAAPRVDELRAHAVSGDVEVEGALAPTGDFAVDTVSGDFIVGLIGGAEFVVRGISTDISSALDHRVEGRLDRRRVIIGSGSPTVVFSSMSGDLSVGRPRRLAPDAAEAAEAAEAAAPEDEQMAVLRALERGEIDVEEATRRLSEGRRDA
ncbi:MAG TPA: DUF4097 family beta strand repeat-containing protein [Candidatus Limnocylindria bacterium]|nr:DUF4097 family beta strand repeat-containing protein [Candidatus Limnocylindria bacterium]